MSQNIEQEKSIEQIYDALNKILHLYEVEGRVTAKFFEAPLEAPFRQGSPCVGTLLFGLEPGLSFQENDQTTLSLLTDVFEKFQNCYFHSILNVIPPKGCIDGASSVEVGSLKFKNTDVLTITFNKSPEVIKFILDSVIGFIKSEIENESHFLVPVTKTGLLLGLVIPRVAADPRFCPEPAVAELNCTLKTALAHFLNTLQQLDPEVLNILQGAEFDLHQTILKESYCGEGDGDGDGDGDEDELCIEGFIKINMFFPNTNQDYETVQGIQTIQKMNYVIDAFWEHIAQDCLKNEITHFTSGDVNDALVPGTVLEMLNKLKEKYYYKWEPIRPMPNGLRFRPAANDMNYMVSS